MIPAKESDLVHEPGGNTLACSSGVEELAAGVHPVTGPQEIRTTLTCNGGIGGGTVALPHAPEVRGHPVLETSWLRPSAQRKISSPAGWAGYRKAVSSPSAAFSLTSRRCKCQ